MERKNRKHSILPSAVILLFAVLSFAVLGYNCLRMYQTAEQSRQHIQLLQTENDQIRSELEQTSSILAEKDAQIQELQAIETALPGMRDQYYAACKQLEDAVLAGTTDKKIAYLTFDDGPYEATTGQYLDVLDQHDVLATFFQLGKTGDGDDALYRRIYNTGHTIANHTYSHQIKRIYSSVDAFISDVVRNRTFIQDKLGITTNILRFPGGSSTAGPLKDGIMEKLRELGYGYVDWNSATGDGIALASPEEYRDNVLNNTAGRNILVVLMHDYSNVTLTALPEIIDGLRAQNYVLLPLFYESTMVNK